MSFKKSRYKDHEKYKDMKRRYYSKTQLYQRKNWNEEEIEEVMNHSISDRELSKKLQRSMASIQAKRKRINATK